MTGLYDELLLAEQRESTIDRIVSALKSNNRLSAKTVNNFRDALRIGKPIRGFKDPIKAPPPALKQHLTDRIEQFPEFAFLIAEAWTETEPQLRDAVREHLAALEPQVFQQDDVDEAFWEEQVSMLAEKNADYEKDDIRLMTKVCYAHIKIEADMDAKPDAEVEDEANEVIMDTAADALSDVMNRLRMLPAESLAWQQEIPQFIESLSELISDKEEERNRLNRMLLEKLQTEFAPELSFFQRGADDWNIANLPAGEDISEAGRALSELESLLQAYHAIHDPADTLNEERARRERLNDLEDSIVRLFTQIDALAENAAAPDNDPDAESPARDDSATVLDATPENQQQQAEAFAELRDELRALKENHDSLLVSNHKLEQENELVTDAYRALQGETQALQGKAQTLQGEAQALRGEVQGLDADKKTLAEEVAELKDQLHISETQEIYWRNMYESEMSSKDSSTPDPIPSNIASVEQALELAKKRYGDKLLVHLNKKSDPKYNYNHPKEVWDALDWLATTYHGTQTGKIRVKDLNESIKNACSSWEYKPNQTDITFNTFREWYTTSVGGTTYELKKHIGKGKGRDGNIIRIAFDWDEGAQRVIVGYIGPHQRNRVS